MRNFFGLVIAIPAFIIMMLISGIGGCAEQNGKISEMEKYGKETITVRYYYDVPYSEFGEPDYDNATVKYTRVHKKDGDVIPASKDGYTFAGYYADPSFAENSWFADAQGNIVITLTDKQDGLMLYPKFIKNG
ncbi:MAG: hypothetical protein IJW60_04515 [Clostridia bacterium]|nr:hypothetical protein [Clostridia bacterium]